MTEFGKCILKMPNGERLLAHHCKKQGNVIYASFGTFTLNLNKEWVWVINKDVKLEIVDNNFTTKDLKKLKRTGTNNFYYVGGHD